MEPGVVKPGDAEAWCLVAQIEARRLLSVRRCLSSSLRDCATELSVRGRRLSEIKVLSLYN